MSAHPMHFECRRHSPALPCDGCCAVNIHTSTDGTILHDSSWPRCHSCGKQAGKIGPLVYVRSDGVKGTSYPMCGGCAPEQIARLERIGFTIREESTWRLALTDQNERLRHGG